EGAPDAPLGPPPEAGGFPPESFGDEPQPKVVVPTTNAAAPQIDEEQRDKRDHQDFIAGSCTPLVTESPAFQSEFRSNLAVTPKERQPPRPNVAVTARNGTS